MIFLTIKNYSKLEGSIIAAIGVGLAFFPPLAGIGIAVGLLGYWIKSNF